MEYLERKYPDIRFIHITMPVRTRDKGSKRIITKILGKDKNTKRMEFNKFMREKYDNASRFDLAYYESVTADDLTNPSEKDVTYLLEEYTTDGGHLNSVGANLIAIHLLNFLCEID